MFSANDAEAQESNTEKGHGGTGQSVRTAQQTCEQSHGYYDAAAEVCELGRE
jgi:hypothetical protein